MRTCSIILAVLVTLLTTAPTPTGQAYKPLEVPEGWFELKADAPSSRIKQLINHSTGIYVVIEIADQDRLYIVKGGALKPVTDPEGSAVAITSVWPGEPLVLFRDFMLILTPPPDGEDPEGARPENPERPLYLVAGESAVVLTTADGAPAKANGVKQRRGHFSNRCELHSGVGHDGLSKEPPKNPWKKIIGKVDVRQARFEPDATPPAAPEGTHWEEAELDDGRFFYPNSGLSTVAYCVNGAAMFKMKVNEGMRQADLSRVGNFSYPSFSAEMDSHTIYEFNGKEFKAIKLRGKRKFSDPMGSGNQMLIESYDKKDGVIVELVGNGKAQTIKDLPKFSDSELIKKGHGPGVKKVNPIWGRDWGFIHSYHKPEGMWVVADGKAIKLQKQLPVVAHHGSVAEFAAEHALIVTTYVPAELPQYTEFMVVTKTGTILWQMTPESHHWRDSGREVAINAEGTCVKLGGKILYRPHTP